MDQETREYFNEVYEETYQNVFRFALVKCNAITDVEDLVQAVYTNFLKRICKNGYQDIQEPKAFLMKTSQHEIGLYYKQQQKFRLHVPVFCSSDGSDGFSEDFSVESRQDRNMEEEMNQIIFTEEIWDEISKQEEVAKIFALYYINEMTLVEIAGVLKIPESSVKSKLYRTLQKLKVKFGERNDDYECERS